MTVATARTHTNPLRLASYAGVVFSTVELNSCSVLLVPPASRTYVVQPFVTGPALQASPGVPAGQLADEPTGYADER